MQPSIAYDPNQSPLYRPTYAASTNGFTLTSTAANTVASLAYLFHPAASTKRIEISLVALSVSGSGGNNLLSYRIARLTAENGAPGGLVQTVNAYDPSDPASAMIFRTGATGAPTRVTGDMFSLASSGLGGAGGQVYVPLFVAGTHGKPIVLRAGQNEGLELRSVIGGSNLTSALNIATHFIWTEI
jgi:hypothetical protein